MHGCFYCFLFVNRLCGKDNDQDRFHRCKNSGKYKLVANEIGIVQNIRCEYFYACRFLKTALSWNFVNVTFQARNISL